VDALIKKLNDLKRDLAGGAPAPAASPPKPVSEPTAKAPARSMLAREAPASPAPPAATAPSAIAADLGAIWNEMLQRVGAVSPFIKSHLVDARPLSFDGRIFVAGYDPEFAGHKELASTPRTIEMVQAKLKELLHKDVIIKFDTVADPNLVKPTPSAAPAPSQEQPAGPTNVMREPPPSRVSKQDFRNDPLIKKALEIFRGQIVDVKA
jgi:hypothetical protein